MILPRIGCFLQKKITNTHEFRPVLRMSMAPPPALADQVYCFAVWEQEADARRMPIILPGTGTMCVFHYRTPYRMTDVHSGESFAERAYIMSNRHRVFDLAAEGSVGFVTAYIRAGRLRHFIEPSFSEIQDQIVPASTLWGDEVGQVLEKLAQAYSYSQRVELLSDFLTRQLKVVEQDPLDVLLDRFYTTPTLRIAQLAEEAGCSRRHLERRFLSTYGVTPKYFGRLARMQSAARRLATDPKARLLDAALDAGYFDQSHFIRDVRDLTGLTPAVLLQNLRERSHFYNPPVASWIKLREPFPMRRDPRLRNPQV